MSETLSARQENRTYEQEEPQGYVDGQPVRRVYLYTRFERFWHWTQATLIIVLFITGFEIHGTYSLFGFGTATRVHNVAAIALIVLAVFAAFWHFSSGEWRQYVPTRRNLGAMAYYYLRGIFHNERHPGSITRQAKLNPLQRLSYLSFKLLIFPVLATTGLLYLFYNRWTDWGISPTTSVAVVALLHTAGAFLLLGFFILHVYMTTTGVTTFENIKGMITGSKRVEVEEIAEPEPGERMDDSS
jgi:thiosulfate reductase cytochrome b subunit